MFKKTNNSKQFLPLLLLILTLLPQPLSNPLIHRIHTTQHLLTLYQQQLSILLQLAHQQNLTHLLNTSYHNNTKTNNETNIMIRNSIMKFEQQVLFEVDLGLGNQVDITGDFRYIGNGMIVGQCGKIIDIRAREVKQVRINGDIICVQPAQVTTYIDENTVQITKLADPMTHHNVSIRVSNRPGKWHHSTKFQDIFIQIPQNPNQNTILLTSSHNSRTLSLKHHPLFLTSLHQYKLIFLTTYSFGYLNPHSLEIMQEVYFNSAVECGYYHKQEATMFVMFRNRTLSTLVQGRVVGVGGVVGERVGREGVGMEYLGGFLIVYGKKGEPCFYVYEVSGPEYVYRLHKTICVPDSLPVGTEIGQYHYQFFKHLNEYQLIFRNGNGPSKLYSMKLGQTKIVQQKSFPWKFVLVVICVLAAVVYRSRSKKIVGGKGHQNENNIQDQPWKNQKKTRRSPESSANPGQDYIKQISNQVKKMQMQKATKNTKTQ